MPDHMSEKKCPLCGEPVKENWKICPVCETNLSARRCPQCNLPVKDTWKRCPECEAPLVCPDCQAPLPSGKAQCPRCAASVKLKPRPVREIEEKICGIRLMLVSGGPFSMGDSLGEGSEGEKPVHEVVVDDFYMGQFPVTQKEWLRLIPDNPSFFKDPNGPVEQVSWHDTQHFITLLNKAHRGSFHFSLPSEAQWEYAARSGGKTQRYAGGDDIEAVAWYENNSQGRAHPVGTKIPNGLELYDMSGNVWEWCQDSFCEDAYTQQTDRNPLIETDAEDRVIRGGSWNLDAWSARCARRFNFKADFFGPALGFRVMMKPAS